MTTNTTTMLDVSVTDEHIRRGVQGQCEGCPIALALRPHLHPNTYLAVDHMEIGMWRRGKMVGMFYLDAPQVVTEFVQSFDAGEPVEPFSFQLTVPLWAVEAEQTDGRAA